MHLIYQLASYLVIGLLMPLWWIHPKLRKGIKRRFGFYPSKPWPRGRGSGQRVWLHGASAGDLLALLPIIKELRSREPELVVIVSTMTNSGHAMANRKLVQLVDAITYVPYDLPGSTRRAVEMIAPDLLVLEYAEIWPNLIHAAKRAGASVALTNGRLSERLVKRYGLLNRLFGNQFKKLDLLMMREEVEADRARALGAPPDRLRITGNTKFDNLVKQPGESTTEPLRKTLRISSDVPVWVAGSTHEGEERGILEAHGRLRERFPNLVLIVAPRYVDRAAKVAALVRSLEMSVMLRSTLNQPDASEEGSPEVIILDTMGELAKAYNLASIAFVGGSFVDRGGQNILEPAGQGRPVLFGPSMRNFRDSVEALIGRGGIQVESYAQLEAVVGDLLERPEELTRLGQMARDAVDRLRGASTRNADQLLRLLQRRSSTRG